jgi:hypothetical protein
VRGLYGDGDMVVTLCDAAATTRDGLPYRNAYTWYFRMKDKKVVSADWPTPAIKCHDLAWSTRQPMLHPLKGVDRSHYVWGPAIARHDR